MALSIAELKGDDWPWLLGRLVLDPSDLQARGGFSLRQCHVVNPNSVKFDQVAVYARCELLSGLLITAEQAGLVGRGVRTRWTRGQHARSSAVAIIGQGPSAVVTVCVALSRGIPVLHLCSSSTPVMTPLVGCANRWVAPFFYESTAGDISGIWTWTPPKIPGEDANAPWNREIADAFSYGHECADAIAQRWSQRFATFTEGKYRDLYQKVEVPLGPPTDRPLQLWDQAIRRNWYPFRVKTRATHVAMLLNSTLFSSEKTVAMDGSRIVYRGIPYWDKFCLQPWDKQNLDVAVSGGGDGALQDFLRVAWKWTTLEQGSVAYKSLFDGVWPEAMERAFQALDIAAAQQRLDKDNEARALLASLDKGDDPRDRIALFKNKLERLEAEMHGIVQERVREVASASLPGRLSDSDTEETNVILRTPREAFKTCFPHNHLFALLTLSVLRRRTSRMICNRQHFVEFRGAVPADLSDYRSFLREGIGKRITVSGRDVDVLLIRHGINAS